MEPKRPSVCGNLRSNSRTGTQARGVALTHQGVFELRRDPIVGRQVFIAEARALRPNDFVASQSAPTAALHEQDCPFCVGNEHQTPENLFEQRDEQDQWQIRVVPNKYPAVSLDSSQYEFADSRILDCVGVEPAGSHEVIVESPKHIQDITELSTADFAAVLRVYRERLRYWSDSDLMHATLFKNVGRNAGASLEHLHSQLIATPFVPPAVAHKLERSKENYEANGNCIFCQLLTNELSCGDRWIATEGSLVACCAYAARQPYELWIMPREHAAAFELIADDQLLLLAHLLQRLIAQLRTLLTPLAYNLVLHSSPFRQSAEDHFHWHMELVPRSTQLAGFEWGTGMHINPLSPERAAAHLRDDN